MSRKKKQLKLETFVLDGAEAQGHGYLMRWYRPDPKSQDRREGYGFRLHIEAADWTYEMSEWDYVDPGLARGALIRTLGRLAQAYEGGVFKLDSDTNDTNEKKENTDVAGDTEVAQAADVA